MSRLPIPDADDNVWGDILNDFLEVSLNSDGSLIASAVAETGAYFKPTGGIPSSDMSSTVQAALTNAATAVQSVNGQTGASVTLQIPSIGAAGTVGAALSATDPTITNSRTPTPHASTHALTGSDPVSASSIGAVGVTGGGEEKTATPTATTASTTISLANGNVQLLTLETNTTISLSGATSGVACSVSLYIAQSSAGSNAVTWSGSVKWPGAAAPTLSTGQNDVDLVVLETLNGGTTWYGTLSGANFG